VSQEYLILVLETKENDQMDETLPYTKDFFNSLGLEQVDENSSPYVNVQNNSLEDSISSISSTVSQPSVFSALSPSDHVDATTYIISSSISDICLSL
jgi:hypothetical protein